MKMDVCSETSAYIIQKPGNYPEESMQHSEQGESFKSNIKIVVSDEVHILFHFNIVLKLNGMSSTKRIEDSL